MVTERSICLDGKTCTCLLYTSNVIFSKSGGFYSGGAAQQDGLYREKRPGRRTGPEKERESASSSRSAPRWPLLDVYKRQGYVQAGRPGYCIQGCQIYRYMGCG